MRRIQIYDTTLRDGSQGEGVSFSLQDKLLIARRLDELGFDYVEGGYPLSNEKDVEFFAAAAAAAAAGSPGHGLRHDPPSRRPGGRRSGDAGTGPGRDRPRSRSSARPRPFTSARCCACPWTRTWP